MAHAFTHAAACDASLQTDEKGRRGVGIGIWMGVQPSVEGSTRHTIAERVGSGMWGMACPSNWQIADAEMYAILRYLRHVAQQSAEDAGGKDVSERRVLILSDCQPALDQVEAAWREGGVPRGGHKGCAAMLEEICEHRARLGTVVLMYTPGHSGISPNEYADAIAKAHAWGDIDPDITRDVADNVRSRPCVYERIGEREGMCQRPCLQEAWGTTGAWIAKQLREGTTRGILLGRDADAWREVVKTVGAAGPVAARGLGADGDGDKEGRGKRFSRPKRTEKGSEAGVCGFTHGIRADELPQAEHSGVAMKSSDERCAGGCGCSADVRHVVLGECSGTAERRAYLESLHVCMIRVLQAVPAAAAERKGGRRRGRAAGERVVVAARCECKAAVAAGVRAVAAAKAGKTVSEEGWEALRRVLAGVIPNSNHVEKMEERAARAAARRITDAIHQAQREVIGMMAERWRGMRTIRERANAEARFERELDRAIRAAEDEQAAQRQQQEEDERRAREGRAARDAERKRELGEAEVLAAKRARARQGAACADTRATRRARELVEEDTRAKRPRHETAEGGERQGDGSAARVDGWMAYKKLQLKERWVLFVYEIEVSPTMRGKAAHMAARMMEMMLEVDGDGVSECHLIVRTMAEQQRPAVALYDRLGMAKQRTRAHRVPEHEPGRGEEYRCAEVADLWERVRREVAAARGSARFVVGAGESDDGGERRVAKEMYGRVHSRAARPPGDGQQWDEDHEHDAVHMYATLVEGGGEKRRGGECGASGGEDGSETRRRVRRR